MKEKSLKRILCILLSASLLLFGPTRLVRTETGDGNLETNSSEQQEGTALTDSAKQLEGMKLAAENDTLALYIDEAETDIAVEVKANGDLWFSNPPSAAEDPLATAYYQKQMKSQLSIQYYNDNVQSSEMDNYNDSIVDGQFEIQYIDNGVTILYTLGKSASKIIIPDVISEERMNYYMGLMEEKAAKKVKRNYTLLSLSNLSASEKEEYLKTYPGLETHNIYILKDGAKDYVKEELMEYFTAAGYTAEEKEKDAAENGAVAEDDKPWFKIPLTYTLEQDNLKVTVDPEKIEYNTDGYYLVDIDLLEYFGAAGSEEDGYLFVPDGSGALIHLNNGKVSAPAYNALIYGQDKALTFMNEYKSEVDESLTAKMPVFGLKTGDKAWFAIIEEGDGYADINAAVSGVTNSFNNVFAGFSYLRYGSISLDEIVGSNSFQMYSKAVFEGSYIVSYSFLHGEDASYSGMAACYRDYLKGKGYLSKKEEKSDTTFFVEYIGAIEKYKTFLGIKYLATQVLTTFGQAEEITSLLKEAGISNIKVTYSGWSKGGLKGNAVTNTKVISRLNKNGTSLKEFMANMEEQGIPVYMNAQFQYVYQDKLFDGYNKLANAPRYFDNTVIQTGDYYVANGRLSDRDINLISPYYIGKAADKFMSAASKYKISGVSIGSVSYDLFSDLYSSRYLDRQMAIKENTQTMKALSQEYGNGLIGDNANVYTLPYITGMLNAPMDSNRYLILDEVVPFYEMVIRGYIDYAGEPLNLTDDYRVTLLKSVESGAGIYFRWIYTDNSVIKDSDFDDLYSVNYSNWLDQAVETYHRVNSLFVGLEGQTIKKHEKLEAGVFKTTYEQGTEIVVNYNKEAVTVDGITIAAKDFAVVKEGN